MYQLPDNNGDLPLLKFESMLKTNTVYFFDSNEFEEIVSHYMDVGKISLAKKAIEKGLKVSEHVKTSLAPGSKVVTNYLSKSGLLPFLIKLGFDVVGYGCTTCIGNSGDFRPDI